MPISLRPVTNRDIGFLANVYASTRRQELSQTGWSEDEIEAFLNIQFEVQRQFYKETYENARFDIIEAYGKSAGNFYVDRKPDEIRIIDIALLPEYRNKGIATHLIRELLAEARDKNLTVHVHVEQGNPAISLYRRLGFKQIETRGIYRLMEKRPRT
ncbi:MAG TPA: N-acetyltransferase [Gammaproteobacteria bacterium]|jgi:ribosomal protein S18 acetylase RimI-like enzyme